MARAPQAGVLPKQWRPVTEEIARIPLQHPQRRNWWICFAIAASLLLLYIVSAGVLFWKGVGVWGLNIPVNWEFAIANYIWWLGLGHAGTLISAMLLLLGQKWRNSLNRFAEAMTLFAVVCAGMYPILHLGRPWYFYWMAPYPSTMGVWPQFRSPLTWDFFAVLTYLIVSVLFWYIGIVPDLASVRDRAKSPLAQILYGVFALGWRGASRHWARWQKAYRLTAAIAVPLVVSVHSEVSLILAAGPLSGWNSTVFPPYFVLGAAFSGFAVVAMIAIVLRHAFGLQNLVTDRHLELLALFILATGMMTSYGYVCEVFNALYSGQPFDLNTLSVRLVGRYSWSFWGAVVLNFASIQLLWFKRFRGNPWILFFVGLAVAVGMWCERYMLLATGLYRDYLVSSWRYYHASFWEWSLYIGSLGLFFTPFLLFIRYLPMISAFEIKETVVETEEEAAHG